MLHLLKSDPAEAVAQAERDLSEARAALDTAYPAYGAAVARCRGDGTDPESAPEAIALNAATRRLQQCEAALDYARGEQRAAELRQQNAAAQALRKERRKRARAAIEAAAAWEAKADTFAAETRAVWQKLESFIEVEPDAIAEMGLCNLSLSALLAERFTWNPATKRALAMSDRRTLCAWLPSHIEKAASDDAA